MKFRHTVMWCSPDVSVVAAILLKFLKTSFILSLVVLAILIFSRPVYAGTGNTQSNPLKRIVEFFFPSVISPVPVPRKQVVLGIEDTSKTQKAVVDMLEQFDGRISTLENLNFSGSFQPVSFNGSSVGINILRNSSFESADGEKPRQWYYIYDSTTSNTKQTKEAIRSGSNGIKYTGANTTTGGLDLGISQPEAETVPGRPYTLSTYLKYTNVESGTYVRIGFWDKYNNFFGPMKTIAINGTRDWYRLSTTIQTKGLITDSSNWYPMVEVRRLKEGSTVYMDDTQLEEGSVLTLYNSAAAGSSTGASFGDGSVLATNTGTIYPAQDGIGSLGKSSHKWHDLYLSKATINENGDLTLEGDATIGDDLTVNDTTNLKGGITLGDSASDGITITGTPTFSTLSTFTSGISIGSAGEFAINSSGDITKLKGIAYSFPSAQGSANTILINDGAGSLNWGTFGSASVTADSLDFAQFVDAMTLDATTTIDMDTNSADLNFDNGTLYIDNAGYVGIGTTAPASTLDVNGNIRFSSTITTPTGINASYYSGGTYLTIGGSTGGSDGRTYMTGNVGINTNTPANKFDVSGAAVIGSSYAGSIIAPSNGLLVQGNVGIGTTSPSYKLEVLGTGNFSSTLNASGRLYVTNSANPSDPFLHVQGYGIGASPILKLVQQNGAGNSNLIEGYYNTSTLGFRIKDSGEGYFAGNVGIGTTNPGAKLEVVGGGKFGFLGSGITAPSNGLLIEGNVGIGTTAPAAQLEMAATSNPTLRINASGTGADGGIIEFTRYGSLSLDLAKIITETGAGHAQRRMRFQVNNGTSLQDVMTLYTNGGVGIGTTLPVSLLDVAGTSWLRGVAGGTSGLFVNSSGNVGIGTTSPGSKLSISGGLSVGTTSASSVYFGKLAPDGGALFEGNVGIGTTAPSEKFVVFDGTNDVIATDVGSGPRIQFGAGSTYNSYMELGAYDGINKLDTKARDFHLFSTAATTGLFFESSNGNIGIGTTSPNYKLEVSGGFTVIGEYNTTSVPASISGGQGAMGVGWNRSGGLGEVNLYNLYNSGAGFQFSTKTGASTYSDLMYIKGDGSVGIGTTSPGSKLSISGGLSVGTTSASSVYFGKLAPDGGAIFEGNVGIGTTSPNSKLHVDGVIETESHIINGGYYYTGGVNNSDTVFNEYGMVLASSVNVYWRSGAGAGGDTFLSRSGSNTLRISSDGTNGLAHLMVNGNVGIGTTLPAAKLDVAGTTWLRGGTGPTGLFVNSSGYVGIGTTGATSQVQVSAGGSGPIVKLENTNTTLSVGQTWGLSFVQNDESAGGTGTNGSILMRSGSRPGIAYDGIAADMVFQINNDYVGAGVMDAFKIQAGGKVYVNDPITNGYNGLGQLNVMLSDGITTPSSKAAAIAIMNSNTTTNNLSTLMFGTKNAGGSNTETAAIYSINGARTGNWGNGSLVFSTSSVGIPHNERMRIDYNGNIGIGATAPGSKLSVSGGLSVGTTSASSVYLGKLAPDGGAIFEGNVGIGTTNPQAKLSINTGVSTTKGLIIEGVAGQTADLAQWLPLGGPIVVINSSGNIGIGVSSPAAKLDILSPGDEDSPMIRLRQGASPTYGIDLSLDQTGNGGLFFRTNNNGTFANAMVIARDSGYVGIGTTAPTQKLEVAGNLFVNNANLYVGTTSLNASETYGIQYINRSNNFSEFIVHNQATRLGIFANPQAAGQSGSIGATYPAQAAGIITALNTPFVLGTNTAERMRIDSLGNVGIGTTSPGSKLSISGGLSVGTTSASSVYFGKLAPDGGAIFEGNVGIGTTNPQYTLDVAGDINTTGDIRKNGTAYTNPDYVFEPDYELMSLEDLKIYVAENKHLPNVPSSEDVRRDGVKLFEQTRLNLEKTEEAYLYLFDLDDRVSDLSLSLPSITADLSTLEEQVESQTLGVATTAPQVGLQLDEQSSQELTKLLEGIEIEDETGAWEVKKDVHLWGQLVSHAQALFEQAVTFLAEVTFGSRVTFADRDMGGFAVVKQGSDEVEIVFEKSYTQTPIITVSLSTDDEVAEKQVLGAAIAWNIKKKSGNGFILKLNKAAPADTQFSWTAIAIKDAKIIEGKAPVTVSEPVQSPTPTATSVSPTVTPSITDIPSITPEPTSTISPTLIPTP